MTSGDTAYLDQVRNRLIKLIEENHSMLYSTHSQVSIPVIERIARKLKAELFTANIYVKHDSICEGHHRYLASLLSGVSERRNPGEFPKIYDVYNWSSVHLNIKDFDTENAVESYLKETAILNAKTVFEVDAILSKIVLL